MNDTTDPTEDLKNKATAFVLALTDPALRDTDVAWTGITAVLAAMGTGTTFSGAQKAVERLRRLAPPNT